MKKILALLALVLGVVSCQTEPEGLDVNVGGEQEVAVCVTIPETETRAGGLNSALGVFDNGILTTDATMRYILQVYYKTTENGEVKYTASKERLVKYNDGNSVTFPVRLVPNRDYQFVVWADVVDGENADDKHYNTADLTNVQLNRTWVAMDETRDAFTATQLVENYNSTSSINITLKRPFAKLRVVTTDMVALNNLGIKPTKATVTYSVDHYNAFNALAGNAIGDSKNRTIKHENFVIASYNENVAAGANMTLFTDYFFAEAGDVVKFELDVFDQNGVSIKKNNFNTDIAVQRNYLTTIAGNILTDGNNVTVKVEDAFVNGSEWNPGDDKYDVEVWDGKSISAPKKDAEGNYLIKTPSELAWLAAAVNGTLNEEYTRATVDANDFSGKTFILSQDIDLGNEPWTPIGSNGKIFKGTFDGNNKKIANLVVNGYNSNVGLFGDTRDGEIKNVTIENAKVSGRLNVGVVAGNPYTSKYTDITVKGHVEVNGMAYVGGVGGKNAYADWTRITVAVDETSYVKANSVENGTAYRTYVGGVVGFNGEGGHKFSNITSNINVEGSTCDVGGLFGIAHYGNQFENCVCTGNVTITTDEVENALEMGGIAGVWNNGGQDVVFTDCSFTGELSTPNITEEVDFYYNGLIGNPYSATANGKLIIDGAYYVHNAASMKAALEAGAENIVLGTSFEAEESFTVAAGKTITLDLAGNTITGTDNTEVSFGLITNLGNLTIKDSGENGKITLTSTINSGWGRYSSVVSNQPGGNLTVESGIIEHLGGTDMAYGIDNLTNGGNGDATATINGGTVKSTYRAIRQFLNSDSKMNTLVVNGGTIDGRNNKSIWMQDPSKKANTGKLVVNEDAKLYGDVYLTVTAGSTEWPVEVSIADAAFKDGYTVLDNDNIPAGSTIVNNNGVWTVDKTYEEIKEGEEITGYKVKSTDGFVAVADKVAENPELDIVLTDDIDLTGVTTMGDSFAPIGSTGERDSRNRLISEPFKGTFDGGGHTIKGLYQSGWDMGYEWGQYGSIGLFAELEGATVKNVTIEAMEACVEGGDISFIAGSATGDCVFEDITIKSSSIGTYNNGCGGIIGWSGAGTYTFKNITLDSDVVLGGLWGSFDSSIGGIVGQAEPGATYNFDNVTINCRIDAYNDCTASYDYYNYRMCGMIIGRCEETTTIDGRNYPDLSKYNMTFDNVVVNYGKWMNYHYCEPTPGLNGGRGMRIEAGYAYDGLPSDFDHTQCVDNHYNCIPFDQLIGGDQIGVKGLREVEGVTVNYPAAYVCSLCGETHNE